MKKEGAEEGEDGGRQGSGGQRYVYIIEAGGLARSESYGGGKGHGVEGGGGGGKEGHGLKGGRGGKEATGGSLPCGACSREGREEGIERRQRGQMRHDLFHPF